MKIEFVKETKVDGGAFYFTQIDGKFVEKSLSFKIEEAKIIFDNIVKNNGKIDFREVIESVEIEEEAQPLVVELR